MNATTDPARHRRLKTVLAVLAAIVAMPFVLVMMFMTGERR